jgi:hypothetical protein
LNFGGLNNSNPLAGAPTNNIIWVQGIEGAKAWQLNPNSFALLLDSENEGRMYIKVSDNIGMSSLRIFNFVEENAISSSTFNNNANVPGASQMDLSQFVTKEELKKIVKELVDEQSVSATATANKPKVIYTTKQQ